MRTRWKDEGCRGEGRTDPSLLFHPLLPFGALKFRVNGPVLKVVACCVAAADQSSPPTTEAALEFPNAIMMMVLG